MKMYGKVVRIKIRILKKDNQFQNLINRIKNSKQYCFERKHYPGREKSAVTRMYSKDTVDYVIKNYKTKK